MQSKFLLALALLSPFTTITAQDFATPTNFAQIESDIGSYISSLAAQPAFTSVQSVLATGFPQSIINQASADPEGFLQSYFAGLATATALPSYYSALPSDVLSYLSSVGMAEISIVTKALGAAEASTGAAGASMGDAGASTEATGASTMDVSTMPSTMVTSTAAVGAVGTASTVATFTSAANLSIASTDSGTPSTTTSKAAAPSGLAVQAAGVLVAAGAVGLALM